MSGELGRASYALDADLGPLRRNIKESRAEVSDFERVLDSLSAIADIAAEQLKHVKITSGQSAESKASAEGILSGVHGISDEARTAARELDKVKLTQAQATETRVVADEQVRSLKKVEDQALKTRAATGGGGSGGRGAIGLLGAAIGAGTLLGPAAGPATVGLLASIPVLATSGAGALGVLALAFGGVFKAIGGDKKAFDDLGSSAQGFVLTIRSLDGWFDKLKQTAGGALFPGLTAGLKSALSPGTLNAITQAVTGFGHAIGDAGAAWGKYFGSAQFQQIFGPLMQAGARNLGTLADAALHLFDAMGVLARAAIPFTDWLVKGIDAGSRWADAYMHASDASGALGHTLNEAESSLRLVGNLFVSLGRAVYELGAALYPVSRIAVKDLTDGLDYLSGVFERNKQEIRDIVSGALAALVSMVKALVPVVTALVHGIEGVVNAIGGWKTAFEIILSGLLISKVAKLGGSFLDLAGKIVAIGPKLASVGIDATNAATEVGGLRFALMNLGSGPVLAAIALAAAAVWGIKQSVTGIQYPGVHPAGDGSYNYSSGGQTYKVYPGGKPGRGYVVSQADPRDGMRGASAPHGGTTAYYQQEAAQFATQFGVPAGLFTAQINQESGFNPNAVSSAGAKGIAQFMPGTAKGLGVNPDDPTSSLSGAARLMASYYKKYGRWDFALAAYNGGPGAVDYFVKHGYYPASETTNYVSSILGASGIPGGAEPGAASPFGTPGAFTKNLGPKPPKPPVIPNMITDLLNRASANASQSKQLGNVGGTAKRYLENELGDLTAADAALHKLVPKTSREKQQVAAKETQVENKIRDVHTLIKNALFATGDAILPAALKTKLTALQTKFKADSTYASVLTGKAAEAYAATLREDITGQESVLTDEVSVLKAKLAGATGKQKAAIQKELTKVTGQLLTVQEQVVQTLQAAVQTLQQHVATQFASVQAQLFTELGKKFFQNGLLTPLEQQLADMTSADTKASLQDTIDQAQKQYAIDKQTVDITAEQLAADQKAITQAERARDENDLAIRATAERKQADADYATAQISLTEKLATLADAFQNGTGTIADLTALAAQFGLQLDAQNTPSLASLSLETDNLKAAFKDLADYIEKLTGTRPTDTGAGNGGGSSSDGVVGNPNTPGSGAWFSWEEAHSAGGVNNPGNLFGSLDPAIAARMIARTAKPMKAGGIGTVSTPTLFLAGEAGMEDFAFSGAGNSFDSIGGGLQRVEVPVILDKREIARLVAEGFGSDGQAGRVAAQNIDPHLPRVVKV